VREAATFDALLESAVAARSGAPWPRLTVNVETWQKLVHGLAAGRWSLVALWGEPSAVNMAVREKKSGGFVLVALVCPEGVFPSVGKTHPPALRPERAIADLYGLTPDGLPDPRPWLDHGRWAIRQPLAGQPRAHGGEPPPYPFLPVRGESLHQIPVGPVHAGIIEPGHFRFTCGGETVARLEERLGYVHKGIEGLMTGADLAAAARLAGRVSGDSTVAYAWAFARAVESASGLAVPLRAIFLRALMAELERIANHLGDIGAICNDAAFALMLAHCGVLRERVLRAAEACFGHRLMMDRIVPGGVAVDLSAEGVAALRRLRREIGDAFPGLVDLYDNTTSLQDRTVGTGTVSAELVGAYAAGGFVGRASGRAFDARRDPGYAPYGELSFRVPTLSEGDVNARVWIRIREIEQSLGLIGQILERLPAGAVRADPTEAPVGGPAEGAALIEGFRGDVFVWLRLAGDGRVERCYVRDPSWFQWPLLEAAIEGNIVADFPLCNKSFNCSYSGHDL
jgi:Ni,Fe-hydrogenase III large subunit